MKTQDKTRKAHSTLLMYGMFSIIMLFAGLTSAYLVHKKSLAEYNLGLCNFVDSTATLTINSELKNERVGSGYFIYTNTESSSDRVLLGLVHDVEKKGKIDFENIKNDTLSKEYPKKEILEEDTLVNLGIVLNKKVVETSIKLKQVDLSISSFENQFCFTTRWDYIKLPNMFYVSTIIILLSSVFGFFIIKCCKMNNFKWVRLLLLGTLFLGLLFAVFQFFGWNCLIQNFRYLAGDINVASSYLYLLTGLHLAHLIAGLIALTIIYCKSFYNKYDVDNFHGIKLGIQFWHFLTILWGFLFLFLLLVNL